MTFPKAILLLLLVCPYALCADLRKEMLQFLNEISASSNVSSADVYQGQKAGYVTGGGFTLQSKSSNVHAATVTLPRFDAGCGGIDIYTGGFSFIRDKEIVDTLKSLASESAGYAFMLGMECVSPQIASTMKQMQTWANNVNAMNINSCEAAAQIVGSVWPQSDIASQHLCQSLGTDLGFISDRLSSRHQCGDRDGREHKFQEMQQKHQDLSVDYNVAWSAIKTQGALMENSSLAELMMTLMGTVIVKNEQVEVFLPKVSDEAFLRMLLEGGVNTVYHCDDLKRCLVITEGKISIEKSNAWVGHVEDLLLAMQKKILLDEELKAEEIELLVKTRIPLYRYISILTAYKKSVCPIEIHQIAEVVALDIFTRFLKDSVESVRLACLHLRQQLPFADKVDGYVASLDYVDRRISDYEYRYSRIIDQENSIFQKMDMLEKYIAQELHL